jgi:hypothetical protein
MDYTRLPKHALNYKPRGRKIVDAPEKGGDASMPEQVKLPTPRLMMMMARFLYGGQGRAFCKSCNVVYTNGANAVLAKSKTANIYIVTVNS